MMDTQGTMQSQVSSSQTSSRSKRKWLLALIIICLLALIALGLGYWRWHTLAQNRTGRPFVVFHTPTNDSQAWANEPLLIRATASDANNITRVELWIDGSLEETRTSNLAGGVSPFPFLTTWQTPEAGPHTLTVRAFNALGARASASVLIESVAKPDRDGDGIADATDVCPDAFAPHTPDGCPRPDDRDGDGVIDSDDACPDEAGWANHDGCPTPGDRDDDTVADADDACPDLPGDADVEGCPDRDGDSVPDAMDAAPDDPGPADLDGAPDSDGDRVPDDEDLSPAVPGDPEDGGAPPGPDRDGDGAPDGADPCPEDAGRAEDDFCPPPAEDPPAEEGGGGLLPGPGLSPGEVHPLGSVEVEAYYFMVNNNYDRVWCYLQLADAPWERYDFTPEGARQWNIREALGGENSVSLAIDISQPLHVGLECWGAVGDELAYLGTYDYANPPTEWTGQELIASGSGDDGSFIGKYRICSPTCEETGMPAPVLQSMTLGPMGDGPYELWWSWDGNEDWIDGFVLDINHAIYGSSGAVLDASARAIDISDFIPMCGETSTYRIRAFRGDPTPANRALSPPSNSISWTNLHCPRTVAVTFETLETPPHVCDPHCGPLQGHFYVNDTTLLPDYGRSEVLSFNTIEYGYGAYIHPDSVTSIADMFAAIEQDVANSGLGGSRSWDYDTFAPSTNVLTVDLGPRQSLTIGASIYDDDAPGLWDRGSGWIFDNSITIPAEEIHPGDYIVASRGIHMRVHVDVLVGPEAGGPEHLPDLTITDVTSAEESGQIRVHVFNNAAALSHKNVTVDFVNLSSGEPIDSITWNDVSIAPGGHITLQSHQVIEPHNLRVLLDPDNAIAETNEDNNTYETPVRMHVQFTKLRWGDPCESFLSPGLIAEYNFRINIGHRSPEGETTWIAHRRYPWAGDITVDWTDWTTEDDWVLEDDADFDFQFDMPPDHELVIYAEGYEDDPGIAADDYAGRVDQSYGPDVNYGDSNEEYHFASTDWHECHDGTPLGWDTNNFHIWWRINRIY